MALATPNSSNDAALNAQLDITRDASIANLRQKSDEVQTQYRDEAAKIAAQKQRSAEVVQSSINAALDNRAITAEANLRQAIENTQAVENAVYQQLGSPADGINYNRLNGVPLNLHADIVRTSARSIKSKRRLPRDSSDRARKPGTAGAYRGRWFRKIRPGTTGANCYRFAR